MPRAQAERICEQRLEPNAEYVSTLVADPGSFKKKYMLLRHEDVASDAMRYLEKIYQFIGHEPDKEVVEWLKNATAASNKRKFDLNTSRDLDAFSTKRNSKEVNSEWRKKISFEGLQIMQKACEKSMRFYGYNFFDSLQQLTNFTIPSYRSLELIL